VTWASSDNSAIRGETLRCLLAPWWSAASFGGLSSIYSTFTSGSIMRPSGSVMRPARTWVILSAAAHSGQVRGFESCVHRGKVICFPHSLHWDRTRPWLHIPEPPQALQRRLSRPCSHILPPPHSRHWLLCRPCSHTLAPPQALHRRLSRPCSQILPPPHSLHSVRLRPCGQIPDPPHSLHFVLSRPCIQTPLPPQSLHRERRFPWGHGMKTIIQCQSSERVSDSKYHDVAGHTAGVVSRNSNVTLLK